MNGTDATSVAPSTATPPVGDDGTTSTILDMVRHLTLDERHVLMLHYAEGLEPLEISLVLDISVVEVERMLASLRDRVATEIGEVRAAG